MHSDQVYLAHSSALTSIDVARKFDLHIIEHEHDHVLRLLNADVALAQQTGDDATIKMCTAKRDEALALHEAFIAARDAMIDGEQKHSRAFGLAQLAWSERAAGTLDAKQAAKLEAEVVATAAAERFHRNALPALRGAVTSASTKVLAFKKNDARKKAFDETESLVGILFDEYRDDELVVAAKYGREATNEIAAWWPLAEVASRPRFLERVTARRDEAKSRARTLVDDFGETDLDACFAARRKGFAAKKQDALAQAAALMAFGTS